VEGEFTELRLYRVRGFEELTLPRVGSFGVYDIVCEGTLNVRESIRKEARNYAREDDHDGGFLRTAG
jgi:hypothetical protein